MIGLLAAATASMALVALLSGAAEAPEPYGVLPSAGQLAWCLASAGNEPYWSAELGSWPESAFSGTCCPPCW